MIRSIHEICNCNFCNHSDFLFFDKLDEWKLYKCLNCGYIFTNPRPPKESIHLFYEKDYFKDERHVDKFFNKAGQPILEVDYTNRIIDIEHYFKSRGHFLEIGAAFGGFCRAMRDRGWRVDGIEISEDAVAFAKNDFDIKLFCGTIEEYVPQIQYDVIALYQTLEHVYDPKGLLLKAYQMLQKNGLLVIEVPNVRSFDLLISKERKRLSYDLPRHLSHFTPTFLRKSLKEIGFAILETDLYYPQFVLDFVGFISPMQKSFTKGKKSSKTDSEPGKAITETIPLARKTDNHKTKLLKSVSRVFPGWRFTIIARKA